MNTGFDFKVRKLWAAIQGEEKKKIYNHFVSAAVKNGKTSTCPLHPVCICLLNVWLHSEFSTEADSPCARGIVHSWLGWWLKGVQTITSIISILKYTRIYIHLHTFALKHVPMPTHVCECGGEACTQGKKLFIFRPLFATFVLALGLSACLGVTKWKEGSGRNEKKKRTFILGRYGRY